MTSIDLSLNIWRQIEPEMIFWAILEWYLLHLDRFELIFWAILCHMSEQMA